MTRWKTISLSLIVAAGVGLVACGPAHAKREATDEALYKQLEIFTDALSLVQADYVEQPEAKQLIYGALKGMLATLDPYSQFLDPDGYNELKIDTEGQFGGLGIEITLKDDLLTVITAIDDTPAYRAGLKSNDRIVKINGELTRGITLLNAVKKLRGKPNTEVTLTILREGENEIRDVALTRDIIKIKSVREARVIEDGIGYIRMSDFRENTTRDMKTALGQLNQQHVDSLILDLRNNPGGLLDIAVSTAELFLDDRQLIVSTKGRLKNQNFEFRTHNAGEASEIPLVVLINEGSASASEILAGAIQDHHRGVILGTKSHGKASVQTIFPLKDGSALRLTTSKYYTPSGKLIHGEGIHPDVNVPFEPTKADEDKDDKDDKDEKEAKDGAKGKKKGKSGQEAEEIFDRIEHPDQPAGAEKMPMDNQLARAVDLLKGIRVYRSLEHPTQTVDSGATATN